ncbi:MAG TPA: DUF924 family protein [Paenirhodobacter sp.]
MTLAAAQEVVDFWRAAGAAGNWFAKTPAFDQCFRDQFLTQHLAAARGAYGDWLAWPQGALALMILLDQFPRNAFRDTGHMYATDGLCRACARQALDLNHPAWIAPDLRLFFALPFSHSEDLADQDLAVGLNRKLGQPWLAHAEGHRDIIRRFGRFPHRNALLGRTTTEAEAQFLQDGGFRG